MTWNDIGNMKIGGRGRGGVLWTGYVRKACKDNDKQEDGHVVQYRGEFYLWERMWIQFLLISKPPSLLRLWGCLMISRASRTLHLKWCFSLVMTTASSRHMWWHVLLECSAKAEVLVLPNLMSTPCSLNLILKVLHVSPI